MLFHRNNDINGDKLYTWNFFMIENKKRLTGDKCSFTFKKPLKNISQYAANMF